MNNIPYTYLIGWSNYDTWYYGVRYAKNCHPDDLWVEYKTSSKYVTDFTEKHGEPDVVQVRKTFTDSATARLWEEKVLSRMKVISDQRWLNKTNSRAIDPATHPRGENHWTVNNPEYSQYFSQFGPMSNSDTRMKVSGNNHYSRQPGYDNRNHPMKNQMTVDKMRASVSGDNHYTHASDYDNSNHNSKRPEAKARRIEMNKQLFTGYKHKKKTCESCGREIPANNYPQHLRKCSIQL